MKKERNDERPWESSHVIYVYGLLQRHTYVNCVILGKKEMSILTRRLDTDILQDIQRHLAEERRFQFHHRDNLWRKWKNFFAKVLCRIYYRDFFLLLCSIHIELRFGGAQRILPNQYLLVYQTQHWNVRYILQFLQQ